MRKVLTQVRKCQSTPVRIIVRGGKCQGNIHRVGQVFTVEDTTPEGMCLGAWNAIAPYLITLRYGGDFPWEKEGVVTTIHCPDPKGIILELRRIDKGTRLADVSRPTPPIKRGN